MEVASCAHATARSVMDFTCSRGIVMRIDLPAGTVFPPQTRPPNLCKIRLRRPDPFDP